MPIPKDIENLSWRWNSQKGSYFSSSLLLHLMRWYCLSLLSRRFVRSATHELCGNV